MGYTLFVSEFTDISGEDWKIKLFTTTAGADQNLSFNLGPDGFRLSYDFDEYDRCKPVIGSRVQITMYQNDSEVTASNSFYDLLSTDEEGTWRLEIYKDPDVTNTLFWVGEILPEQTIVPDEFPHATISITAVDGLANLKGIKYNNDGAAYTGTTTVLGHLHNLIQKLHVSDIWTATDIELKFFEDFIGKEYKDYIDGGSLQNKQLQNAQIEQDTYYKKDEDNNNEYFSSYEVLESLAVTFNACVFMSEGSIWWVPLGAIQSHASAGLSIANYMLGDGTVTYNTVANTTISAIFGSDSAQWEKLAGWERSTVPSFKKVIRSRDYQGTRSIVSDSLYTKTDLLNETVLDDEDIEYAIGERLCISGTFHYVAGSFGFISNDLDRVARLNLKIKLKRGDAGGAVAYVGRSLGFSTANQEFVGYINYTSGGVPNYFDAYDTLEINSGVSGPLAWDTSSSYYEILSADFDKITGTYDALVGFYPIPLTIPFEIVTLPMAAASTGLQLSAILEGVDHLGATDASLTAATNSSGPIYFRIDNFKVNRYSSEQSQEFSTIDITATNPSSARYDFNQPPSLIGDRISDFDLGIIKVNTSAGSTYTEPTEWTSLQSSSTSLSINGLGVKERLGANLTAARTETGTLYKRGSTWIHPYTILTNTDHAGNFYQVSGLSFIAARSEYDIEVMYLQRNITGIVLGEDNPTNKGPSLPPVLPSTKLVQSNGGIIQEQQTKLGFISTDTYGITKVTTSTGGASFDINLPIAKSSAGVNVIGINTAGAMAPVADGASGEFLKTDGAGVLTWDTAGGGGGFFGSTTIIKVMPSEWIMNDDYTRAPVMVEDDITNSLGVKAPSTVSELYAFIVIPVGFKATHVNVAASDSRSNAVEALEFNHRTGATSSKGTGDFNANIDITDITSSTTANIVIKLIPASATTIIYGGEVTIAAV